MKINKLISTSFILIGLFTLIFSCQGETYKQGKIMYENFCSNCHMDDGSGLGGNIPPLANADYVRNSQEQIACIIRYGMEGEIMVNGRTYNQAMEGIPQLTDFEITNIINYINHAWGNDYGVVKLADVRSRLENCQEN